MPAIRYFAFGSNMCVEQMALRCPAAVKRGLAVLADHRFLINGRGVATVVPTPGACVHGLLWDLTPACEAVLDRYEGVAQQVYVRRMLVVGTQPALVYVAADSVAGPPRPDYLERILAAAARERLPDAYCRELAGWADAAAARG
ncbi:gamma-glutamylcyclotransferase family protein [Zavarzinia sp. CC-PAN008]|uniref:gamma-glutamylcyclotransferase family protein n=1 Tax=Zavarzinia sp. CC-PAN008 TaxID=3243332 RepID=UPI003F74246D